MTLETKRLLVREAIHQHRKYGTKYAVEKLLNTLSRGAKVTEWFEDGYKNPRPYHFKVNLKGLKDLEDDGERIMQAIEVAKNLRSWCDDFDFDLSKEHPDQILHFGILQLFLGKIFHDLNLNFTDNHKLNFWSNEIISGSIFSNLDFANSNSTLNLRAGFILLQSGSIKYDCEMEESDDLWYSLWLKWIRSRYKNFDKAIIRFYKDEDDEPIDDEPTEEEFSGQYIKLWMDYHGDDSTRLLVMNFARDDLTAADINSIDVDGLFINRRGNLSNKIIRSVYVDRKITHLTF